MTRLLKFRQWIPTDANPGGEYYYWGYGVMPEAGQFVPPKMPGMPSEQYANAESIDGTKVYEGDLLQFPGDTQLYEVRWDPDETSLSMFYKDMNVFRMGMARFMQIKGSLKERGQL